MSMKGYFGRPRRSSVPFCGVLGPNLRQPTWKGGKYINTQRQWGPEPLDFALLWLAVEPEQMARLADGKDGTGAYYLCNVDARCARTLSRV